MKKKIFIDGRAGTTGLRIYERLEKRDDIELITLSDDERKDVGARKRALNECDVAFLCLPDDAARESVSLIENDRTVVIDTSTAHRTLEGWLYGFPELDERIENTLASAKRIAVPGCHASGFISLVYPLIKKGILPTDALLTCHSITGYSGGGKKMIAEYESEDRSPLYDAPRQYALGQTHKHLKEMKAITGLENEPVFCPIVSDFYSGMTVTVPLFKSQLNSGFTVEDIKAAYSESYTGEIVKYVENADESGLVSGAKCSGLDSMKISVAGNEDRILLIAMYDNLGKGASGAAVECLNFVLGTDKKTGLEI
ncbi:MAG: N-acetyl-gamma-glutamyl-phosphate reductase [Ruminococcaceae bacterium]|nr:N-acetyl-gamma-glutamyl-phosphate reductase [Oscillospiraceae bacterium]